jgi:O-antigen/teichoic acid export membrane protein
VPLLRRNLEYRALFADEVAQTVAGVVVSIAVAALVPGSGAWALVAGTLAGTAVGVVMSYALAPMTPRCHWDRAIARHLAGFGGAVFVNTLVMAVWLNLDRLLGPRLMPLEPLGWYVLAWSLAGAAEAVVTRGTDVYFTLLTRRSPEERTAWHDATADRVMRLAGPALAAGICVAPLVVRVLYDSRYHAAGVLVAVLLARLLARTAGQIDFQLLLASGRLRPAAIGYIAGAAVQLGLMIPLTLAYGVLGLAASVVVSTVVVAATQALLVPELGRRALARLGAALGWGALGLAAAWGVVRWLG